MDVDGTLTDGKIYVDKNGEAFKAFNVKDGYGIIKLKDNNIVPIIITGRHSLIVEKRAEELKIPYLRQGVVDKLAELKQLVGEISKRYGKQILMDEIAYIGDDENDLDCIKAVGFAACPSDAMESVKQNVQFISNKGGGDGAVREIIEKIISINNSQSKNDLRFKILE